MFTIVDLTGSVKKKNTKLTSFLHNSSNVARTCTCDEAHLGNVSGSGTTMPTVHA